MNLRIFATIQYMTVITVHTNKQIIDTDFEQCIACMYTTRQKPEMHMRICMPDSSCRHLNIKRKRV